MWPIRELNLRPPAYKSDALPTELIGLDSSQTERFSTVKFTTRHRLPELPTITRVKLLKLIHAPNFIESQLLQIYL